MHNSQGGVPVKVPGRGVEKAVVGEGEAVCGGGWPGCLPALCLQHLFDVLGLSIPPAHLDQGAGDDADHVVEKATAGDGDRDKL